MAVDAQAAFVPAVEQAERPVDAPGSLFEGMLAVQCLTFLMLQITHTDCVGHSCPKLTAYISREASKV